MIDAIPQSFIDEINDVNSVVYRQKQSFIDHYWLVNKVGLFVRKFPTCTTKVCLDSVLNADYNMPPEGYYLSIWIDYENKYSVPMSGELELTDTRTAYWYNKSEDYLNAEDKYLIVSMSNILLKKYLQENIRKNKFLIFRMNFQYERAIHGHANTIIISDNKAYILESHIIGIKSGPNHDQISINLKTFLQQFIPEIKIITINKLGCLLAFQGNDRLCSIWSIYMGILFIVNRGNDMGDIYTKVINDNPSEHLINFLFFICKSDIFGHYMKNVLLETTLEYDIELKSPSIIDKLVSEYGHDIDLEKYITEFEYIQDIPVRDMISNDNVGLIEPSWLDRCRDSPGSDCNKCGEIFYNPSLYICDDNKLKLNDDIKLQLNAKDAYNAVMDINLQSQCLVS